MAVLVLFHSLLPAHAGAENVQLINITKSCCNPRLFLEDVSYPYKVNEKGDECYVY